MKLGRISVFWFFLPMSSFAARQGEGPTGCPPSWVPTFGLDTQLDNTVHELATFDDGGGGGPVLYAGGSFRNAGTTVVDRIARWNGSNWAPVGSGVGGSVHALAVLDTGTGPALYVGGSFTTAGGAPANRIARWDGSSWSALGSGVTTLVTGMTVFDGGSGPALYVCHSSSLRRWNGTSWSLVASASGGTIQDLAVFDDGSGAQLYAAGSFTTIAGVAASRIARWNGTTWSAVGGGTNLTVQALEVLDDGSGPTLYAGGSFTVAGASAAMRVASWNGTSWSALGSGVGDEAFASVGSLAMFDDGTGPALWVAGDFETAGGAPARHIARWDGATWTSPGGGTDDEVNALAVLEEGASSSLCVGGDFRVAGDSAAKCVARWDGSEWSHMEAELAGVGGNINALQVFDDESGAGEALYVGGGFRAVGEMLANNIAKWDGTSWAPLGEGVDLVVRALEVFDDGSGPALHAAGDFQTAGGAPASYVARWDGSTWAPLGPGLSDGFLQTVADLLTFDDGDGTALYACGGFSEPIPMLARWKDGNWTSTGIGFLISGINPRFEVMAAFDDGSGPGLYLGGDFALEFSESEYASYVARMHGGSWQRVGTLNNSVHALIVHDDGGGPALFAGGKFTTADGSPASRVAKWNGTAWAPLGSGMNGTVLAFTVFNDGSGPALYAGGEFTVAGGVPANRIARWDGSSWSAVGGGMSDNDVRAFSVFDAGNGPALLAGGWFGHANDSGDGHIALLEACFDVTPPVLSCPASIRTIDPLPSTQGRVVTFTVTANDDIDPAPAVVCVPPSGSFFPLGTTLVTCTASDAAGNQSTCEFPVTVASRYRRAGF